MKRFMVQRPRQCEFVEVNTPTLTPDTVLVKTRYTALLMENVGIFIGTDPRVRQEGHPIFRGYPLTMSAEVLGEVIEIGSEVSGLAVGDRLVAYTAVDEIHRVRPRSGWTKVDASVPAETAISLPYSATTLHCIHQAHMQVGDNVAIIGQGPMGLLVTQWARVAGAGQIVVGDFYPQRLEIARRMGATHTINAKETNFEEAVKDATSGEGADIVIDASNAPGGFPLAMALARNKGRMVVLSWHTKPIVIEDITREFYLKELTILATEATGPAETYRSPYVRWTGSENCRLIARFMAEGHFDPSPLISHRLPMNRFSEAFHLIEQEPITTLKVLLDWQTL